MRWLLESAVQGHQQQPSQTVSAAPPASSVATGLAGGLVAAQSRSGDSFDTNMVIILAALLCALILALGLNSILRCALRCSTSPQAPAGSKVPRGGLKKGALRKLPLTTYVSAGATEAASSATECPICLGDFVDGDQIRPLPGCGHGFHVKCVDTWLVSNSSCPTCRRSLLADGGLKAKEARVAPAAAEQEPRMGYRVRGYLLPSFVIAPPPPLA